MREVKMEELYDELGKERGAETETEKVKICMMVIERNEQM